MPTLVLEPAGSLVDYVTEGFLLHRDERYVFFTKIDGAGRFALVVEIVTMFSIFNLKVANSINDFITYPCEISFSFGLPSIAV